MPDHFHAIVKIVHTESGNNNPSPRKYKPLDQIIGAFKTTSSKLIHLSGYNNYAWQRSYYDRIVRDTNSLNFIREYIIDNPENWDNHV